MWGTSDRGWAEAEILGGVWWARSLPGLPPVSLVSGRAGSLCPVGGWGTANRRAEDWGKGVGGIERMREC